MFTIIRRSAAVMFILLLPQFSNAQVTFSVSIKASGEETIGYNNRDVNGDFPYFEVRGGLVGGAVPKTESVQKCVSPDDLAMCAIDKSGGPGYTAYVDEINSPGGTQSISYTFNESSGCLTTTVTVYALRRQRGWFRGHHAIHLQCPVRGPWSNTETKGPFTLSGSAGYSYITDYTGPIGSAGLPGTATVYANDTGYKAQILNKMPPAAMLTYGMFASGPSSGVNGPQLWVLYDANDITARALEISQGVQNIYNDMPLMAGRRTMARFYVQSKYAASGINAQLRAFRSNVELSGSPLAPESTIGVRSTGIDRTKLDHAFLFKLPFSWTGAGAVQLQATVNPAGLGDEVQSADNVVTELAFFQIGLASINTVVGVPLHLHENGDRNKQAWVYESDNPSFQPIARNVLRMHPVAGQITVDCGLTPLEPALHGFPFHREWNSSDVDHWGQIVNRIEWKRFWSSCGFLTSFWDGMVHPSLPNPALAGIAHQPGHALVTLMRATIDPSRRWYHSGGSTFAHEVGHNKNLSHVCSASNPADQDEDYPYPDPCLMSLGNPAFFSNGHDGYFMLDVYHDQWGAAQPSILGTNSPNVIFPGNQQATPMMSYTPWRWISPYSYCKLLNNQGIGCNRMQISARYHGLQELLAANVSRALAGDAILPRKAREPIDKAAPVQIHVRTSARDLLPRDYDVPAVTHSAAAYLVVDGVFDTKTGTVPSFSLMRVDEPPSENALVDAQANVEEVAEAIARGSDPMLDAIVLWQYDNAMARRPLRIDVVSRPRVNEEYTEWQFLQLVDLAPDARYFELTAGSRTIAALTPSNSAPQVKMQTFPSTQLTGDAVLRWSASDPDGDPLTYSIFYSSDGGTTWSVLAGPIAGNEYRIDENVPAGIDPLRYFAGTHAGTFRVMAYDGFHTATDELATLLTVPGKPPRVTILQPDGYRVEYGRTLYLSGEVNDMEDGSIPSVAELTSAAIHGTVITTEALRWMSSLDGPLGTGPEITTRTLSKGTHRITLSATDSDRNIATAQITVHVGDSDTPFENIAPLAAVSASSTYCQYGEPAHCYDPARAIDGDRSTILGGTASWSNDTVSGPHWLELTWPAYVKLDQVDVYTTDGYPIREYDVQAWNGTDWTTVVVVRGNTQVYQTHTFAPVTTTRLRVLGYAGPRIQPNYVRVNELVVYGMVVDGDPTGGRG